MTERKLLCFSDHNYFQEEGGAEQRGLTEFLEGVAVLQAIKYFRGDDEPRWPNLSFLYPLCLVYFFGARKLLCGLWWQGPGCCWWLGQFPLPLWASEAVRSPAGRAVLGHMWGTRKDPALALRQTTECRVDRTTCWSSGGLSNPVGTSHIFMSSVTPAWKESYF